ncbi:MAG: hypothetical protein U9N49_03250 [Campylobacterota bacterium]|nr:hypothetical protein [Campylobacterota bacterium]
MIKIEYPSNINQAYYNEIAKSKGKLFNGKSFEAYYNHHYKSKLGYELKEILCGDFEQLLTIKNTLGTKYAKDNFIKKFFNYDYSSSDKFKPLLSKLQPKISKFIQEHLSLHTCYYCNIELINTFEGMDKKTKNAFTLDHVIDKGTYPYLALSLYNFVPSCYVCNSKVKRTKSIESLSPTSKDFDFEEKVKFKTFLNNYNLLFENPNDIELRLIEDFSNKFDDYTQALNLNNRYQYHKDKVIEMIHKRKEYPDSRIEELSNLTQKTYEEVKQDLFGIYLNEDLHKRPLSKLIKDISEELKLT